MPSARVATDVRRKYIQCGAQAPVTDFLAKFRSAQLRDAMCKRAVVAMALVALGRVALVATAVAVLLTKGRLEDAWMKKHFLL